MSTHIFNHTGHVAMWNYVVNTLSSITEETIRNTSQETISEYVYIKGMLPFNISSLKEEYIRLNKLTIRKTNLTIKNSCFACEYAFNTQNQNQKIEKMCKYCPFSGIDIKLRCMNNLYKYCSSTYTDILWMLLIERETIKTEDIDLIDIECFLTDLQEVILLAKLIRDFPVKSDIVII